MSIAYRVSAWNRKRKWSLFRNNMQFTPSSYILDVGYNDEEYSTTDNYIEKHYPYRHKITALGVKEPKIFSRCYPDVRAVQYDGSIFPFPDKAFDICWSNAVLEHVGNKARQVLFLSEIKRVSKAAFITTPNRHFPIEVHTRTPLLHFMPKRLFDAYLRLIGKSWAAADYMNLLSETDLRKVLHEAGITSYRIHKNRFCGFTMEFVVIIGSFADDIKQKYGEECHVIPNGVEIPAPLESKDTLEQFRSRKGEILTCSLQIRA